MDPQPEARTAAILLSLLVVVAALLAWSLAQLRDPPPVDRTPVGFMPALVVRVDSA